jgi:CheY-like chemotaxis protein
MTNEHKSFSMNPISRIDQDTAEKLIDYTIAGMRGYLSLMAGIEDAEKLIPFVLETWGGIFAEHLVHLVNLVEYTRPQLSVDENEDFRTLRLLDTIVAKAIAAERGRGDKKHLPDAVSESVLRGNAALDKIAQALREKSPMTNEPSKMKRHVNHRIVVVDDSLPFSVQLGQYIQDCFEDAKVLVFQDGLSAWKEISQTDPDVLITDMHRFSDMSGWDMLPLLAERNVKYPILIITGYREEKDPDGKTLQDVRDLLQGACSNLNVTIMPKPFPLPSLLKALESCLKISSEI